MIILVIYLLFKYEIKTFLKVKKKCFGQVPPCPLAVLKSQSLSHTNIGEGGGLASSLTNGLCLIIF